MVSLLTATSALDMSKSTQEKLEYRTDEAHMAAFSREMLYDFVFGSSLDARPSSRQDCEEELNKLCSSDSDNVSLRIRAAYELGVRANCSYVCAPEFSSPHAVEREYAQKMNAFDQEHFVLLCLNAKNYLLKECELSVGTLDKTIVGVRDVVKQALLVSARSVILVHNHPSGDPHPSHSDIELSKRIIQACDLFEICVLDHVIVGSEGRSYSLRSYGDM